MAFSTTTKIHFDEADPAGVAFSGQLFTKMHRCYEGFISHMGISPQDFFLGEKWAYPLRAIDCEYFSPLLALHEYDVEIQVLKISETSFKLGYSVKKQGKLCAKLNSVHVCINKSTGAKAEIPHSLKVGLEKHLLAE